MSSNAKSIAESIAREAIAAIDLGARVSASLAPLPPPRAKVVVVAIGKAAPAMARAAIDRWTTRIDRALVITTDGTDASALDGAPVPVDLRRASHPLPDDRSLAAAQAALDLVRGESKDLTLALISGGASSLVCAPVEGVSLETKRDVVRALLDGGAPISEINLVRRHLSRIKGGGLARAALPGRTLTLVVSDVLVERDGRVEVGDAADVGSGPASADPTSVDEARRALERRAPALARAVEGRWTTNLATTEAIARRAQTRLVATPLDLADAAASVARSRGLDVEVLPPSLATVDDLAADVVERARTLEKGRAIVRVAEPSVVVPSSARRSVGKGGRAGRLALRVWSLGLPDDVAFACVASDGVDGSSGRAGAIVSGRGPAGVQSALDAFDDGPFLAAHGASIAMPPTGTNLLDLQVLVRDR
jgi:hydroxypyruvate reductase